MSDGHTDWNSRVAMCGALSQSAMEAASRAGSEAERAQYLAIATEWLTLAEEIRKLSTSCVPAD